MHFDHLPMTGQSGLTYAHSVQSFMIAQEAARYTPKTLEIYRHVLGRFAEDLGSDAIPVADISPTSIRAHLIKLEQRGLKDTTVHHHARHLKAFLNWLVREELLADSPVRKVTMPRVAKRVHEAFTKEQLEALLVATSCKTAWGANQTEAYIASRRPRLRRYLRHSVLAWLPSPDRTLLPFPFQSEQYVSTPHLRTAAIVRGTTALALHGSLCGVQCRSPNAPYGRANDMRRRRLTGHKC